MRYKTGYQISKEGFYIKPIQIRENPRKKDNFPCSKNIVFVTPLKGKSHFTQKWTGDEWVYEPDFRGTWWDKLTADAEEVDETGIEIDLEKYTDSSPDGRFNYQYFNDITQMWEEDALKQADENRKIRIIEIGKELDKLDAKKIRYIIEKEKGDLSGKKYFDEYEAETLKLREELKEL